MKDLAILRTLTQRTICVLLVSVLLALQAESAFSQTTASSTPHENPGGAVKNYDCVSPPGWDIVPTPTSFIIIIESNAEITINGTRINTCDFVGCFYRDDIGNLKCSGACAYTQNGANAFVAFGDDPFTPEKEGFVPGDTMFFKIFSWSCAGGRAIDVDTMAFDPLTCQTTYIWNPNNQTAITYMACCTDFDCQIAAPVAAKKNGNHTNKKSRNSGKSFLSDFDDPNNQSNHFYYYNSNNTIGYDVEPLDYKVSTVTKVGKPIGNWNFEDGCPYNLTTRESGSTEESGSLRWTNLIGMPGRDDFTMNILEHYDRGYLITGNIYYGGENTHGWLIKTDINGQVLWDKVITTLPDKALIAKTLFDSLGNIYVFGWLIQNQPHEFPFVAKLNACGELQWCRLMAIDGYEYGFPTDAIFLENGDLLSLVFLTDPDYKEMVFLLRMSPDGELIWKKEYASLDNHKYYGTRIGQDIKKSGDLLVITGYVYSPYPNSPNPYHVYQRPMFIGIDENFDEQWVVEFGINDSLLGKAETVVPINDTLFMGVGRYRFINENGDMDMKSWLMYFNNNGEEVGYKILEDEQFGSEVLESCLYEVECIEGDKYLLSAGYVTSEISAKGDLVADTAGNVYNYEIREHTTSGGNIYLTKTFDKKFTLIADYQLPNQTTSDIYLYKINENLEQDTVYPGNYTYDSLCGHTIESGVIDLGGCDVITAIGEIPTLEAYNQKLQTIPVKASPNPTNTGEILLEFENTSLFDNLELKVFDVFGKQVHTGKILPHQGAARIDVSNWGSGVYVAVVFSYGEMKGKCKVVVE
jgi:hypothetical protein